MKRIFIIFAVFLLISSSTLANNAVEEFETYSIKNTLNKEKTDRKRVG